MDMDAFSRGTVLAMGFLIWLLPIIMIYRSARTSGNEKLIWLLAVVFISWMAWVLYLLVAPVKKG